MEHQTIQLDAYDWQINAIYDLHKEDIPDAVTLLTDWGGNEADIVLLKQHFADGKPNKGMTITNSRRQKSCMVIGYTDSAQEWLSTLIHEVGHATAHIGRSIELNPYSEDWQYLSAEIASQAFPIISHYICESCRKV